jgi:hypothetical protein
MFLRVSPSGRRKVSYKHSTVGSTPTTRTKFMQKRSTDKSWQVLFEVRMHQPIDVAHPPTYDIVNIHNDTIVGTYRHEDYAKKQARRKYKKLIKLMEKQFMSTEFS